MRRKHWGSFPARETELSAAVLPGTNPIIRSQPMARRSAGPSTVLRPGRAILIDCPLHDGGGGFLKV